jgi:hypothetical protein
MDVGRGHDIDGDAAHLVYPVHRVQSLEIFQGEHMTCKHRWEEINFAYRHPTHYLYRCARCSATTFTYLKGKQNGN